MKSASYHKKLPQELLARRMQHIPGSFIREILKVTAQKDVISFAGGLPNPSCFPSDEIRESALCVLSEDSASVLQYAVSEGYLPLREYIADHYHKRGITVDPSEILITNGSQQGLDLCGKIFLNPGDSVLLENPSYLGAIQAFSAYQPEFVTATLEEDGINIDMLQEKLWEQDVKLFYAIPNFQNPTGISYSLEKRMRVAEMLQVCNTILVEDDPYGDIRFSGETLPSIKKFLPEQTILLGSFSKIIAPGLRLGWVVARREYIEKMIIAKQASDLHSNFLSQRIIHRYLMDYDLDRQTERISLFYKKQKDYMIEMIRKYFPEEIRYTNPEGGMFIWLILPEYMHGFSMIEDAMQMKIAFVPGETFYIVKDEGKNTIRLNFSNSSLPDIEEGIMRLGKLLYRYICNP